MKIAKTKIVLQFKIELAEIEPLVWRRIEVPSTYSFWDLHVAIQDAMGWLDYHLHQFEIRPPRKRKPVVIGIPDEDDEMETLPGWKVPVAEYLKEPGDEAVYEYDFGDGWRHRLLLEGRFLQQPDLEYPRCSGGGRACPPEDVGGLSGYDRLLEILADRSHPEYADMEHWLRHHAKCYWPYDPDCFDPAAVAFWDPKRRFKLAFEQ